MAWPLVPEQRYTVFVSSTHLGNEQRRQLVLDAILQAGMAPVMVEHLGARNRPPLDECLAAASTADLLICIVAHRYGSIPDGRERSYIELEYEANPERLVFLIDPKTPCVPDRDFDAGPDRWKKQAALELFRERARKNGLWAEFDENTLQARVLNALNTWKTQRSALPRAATESGAIVEGTVGSRAGPSSEGPAELVWARPDDCPFPGLSAYDEDRALLYAGREEEIGAVSDDLARRLGTARGRDVRWIQVEGASGAGKSSFALAGLLPRLRAWNEEGSLGQFRIAVLRPRDEPLRSLAVALARSFPGQVTEDLKRRLGEDPESLRNLLEEKLDPERPEFLVLVIDQLEELFTYAPDAEEAPERAQRHAAELTALSDNLAVALTGARPADGGGAAQPRADRPAALILVTTIRRDYLEELTRLASLDALTNRTARHVLRPMDAQALERAVRRPAQAAGLEWSPPDLPERIAGDAVAGGLALLGRALEALWQQRDGRILTKAEYERIGRPGRT